MRRAAVWGALALALAFALGVGSAEGRSLATTTVTVQVIGKGRVTSSPSEISCGDGKTTCYAVFSGSVTLTASNSASGWTFAGWSGGGCSGTGACTPTPDAVDDVTATFAGPPTGTSTLSVSASLVDTDGDGTVDSGGHAQGGAIDCGSGGATACSATVLTGSTLTLLETPDPGMIFTGWNGACNGLDAACTVEMDGNKNVSAAWSRATAPKLLTVSVAGDGTVKGGGLTCDGPATCTQEVAAGTNVTLTASPEKGFVFTGWTGACTGTGTSCMLTLDADRTVTATFTAALPLSVQVSGNGNVSGGLGAINCGNGGEVCSASFAQNATVTLVATPATGALFAGWSGACGGTATTCTVLMSAARSVSATFTGGTTGAGFALTVSVAGSGSVVGGGISCGNGATTCSANQAPNATVTLVATPASGQTFTGWGGACAGTATTCTVVMTAARSVTATFSGGGTGGATVQLAVTVTGSGVVSGGGISCGNGSTTCRASVSSGSTVTLVATPTGGATFRGWGGSCNGASATCTLTLTASSSVTATFSAAPPGTVTITVNGRGTISTRAGKCVGAGAARTCVQHLTGTSATLTATPAAGQAFGGWGGSCASAATKPTCTLSLAAARAVTATFNPGGSGRGGAAAAVLTSRGAPLVRRTGAGFRVTLRFGTTQAGVARVRGLRAGRVAVALSLRVAAGPAAIGPFQVAKSGLYTFEVQLGGRTLRWRTCLGRCGRFAPGPRFVLTRSRPTVTRSGDVWSVTLHLRANLISAARVQAFRQARKLVDQRFLARTGAIAIGPFLLGPGSYTLRLTATDAYGRTRTLSWIVSLAA
jgi:uncharacterized repeat protein (TIGR02543 family)